MSETAADAAAVAEQEADADFGAGFADKPAAKSVDKPETKPEPAAPEGATEQAAESVSEYVQISAKEWAEVKAAAAKTASYDAQLSKAFGTIGNLQKVLNEQKAKADVPAQKVELSKQFAEMQKDFPELAAQVQAAVEGALTEQLGKGTGNSVAEMKDQLEQMVAAHNAKVTAEHQMEELEDAYPEWRTIVGAVSGPGEAPNPDHPFRKWLTTKDATYQARINGTTSASVIMRAIRTFQNELKAATAKPAAAKPREDARAERFRGAVQPRGDNGGVAATMTEDDEFAAGFKSR